MANFIRTQVFTIGSLILPAELITNTIDALITSHNTGRLHVDGTNSMAAALSCGPVGTAPGNGGELRLLGLAVNGTKYVGLKAVDNPAVSTVWTMPAGDGTSGQFIKTDGASTLSFGTAISSLGAQTGTTQTFGNDANVTITSASNVHTLGWSGTLAIARGGTASITAAGARASLGAAASGTNSDITALTGLTTPLAVSYGGSGTATLTLNGLLVGNGTGAIIATSAGTADQVCRIPSAGGAPAFGAVNLAVAAAVTGTLSAANGGTGTAVLTANNVILGNGASPVQFVAPGANGNVLKSNGTIWTSAAGVIGVQDGASVTKSASQSIPINTLTTLSWDVEQYNNGNLHNTITNNNRFTVNSNGIYLITAAINYTLASTAGNRQLYINHSIYGNIFDKRVLGTTGDVGVFLIDGVVIYRMLAGEYVQVQTYQTGGATESISTNNSRFSIQKVSD